MLDFKGRKILVTGASSGIGRAVALCFSKLGAELIITARNEHKLMEVESALYGSNHQYIPWDISAISTIKDFMEEVCRAGKINGFVHCAGTTSVTPLQAMSYEKSISMMNINYFSFMEITKFFSKKKYSDGGVIIAVSSIFSTVGAAGMSMYSGTKGALESSVRSLALELAGKNIRINCVRPAFVNTEMYSNISDLIGKDSINKTMEKQILGLIPPDNIAEVAAFLMSDMSKYMTGTVLTVDSGFLAS